MPPIKPLISATRALRSSPAVEKIVKMLADQGRMGAELAAERHMLGSKDRLLDQLGRAIDAALGGHPQVASRNAQLRQTGPGIPNPASYDSFFLDDPLRADKGFTGAMNINFDRLLDPTRRPRGDLKHLPRNDRLAQELEWSIGHELTHTGQDLMLEQFNPDVLTPPVRTLYDFYDEDLSPFARLYHMSKRFLEMPNVSPRDRLMEMIKDFAPPLPSGYQMKSGWRQLAANPLEIQPYRRSRELVNVPPHMNMRGTMDYLGMLRPGTRSLLRPR